MCRFLTRIVFNFSYIFLTLNRLTEINNSANILTLNLLRESTVRKWKFLTEEKENNKNFI